MKVLLLITLEEMVLTISPLNIITSEVLEILIHFKRRTTADAILNHVEMYLRFKEFIRLLSNNIRFEYNVLNY